RRVAVNLTGVAVRDVARGDVLAAPEAELAPSFYLDARLELRDAADGQRVQIHHGTREAPGRLAELGDGLWQLRLEQPLLARAGDHVVVRSIAPPDTLGGGVVTDPRARKSRRGAEPEPAAAVEPARVEEPPAPTLPPAALALEERLRAAGHEPPLEAELGDDARHLPALQEAGRAVRLGKSMWAHPDALAHVRARVTAIAEAEGTITLARLRDALQTSRKFAQAHLERLDAERVTLRQPDDSRTLRRRRG
ncbi:MAG TPA: SelB C-terminal domain-containing protein, partial [Solirubrobacteraceae bacterium]|nr:SelB C-terminal domain-containing protein [Solirubrobacteraceae bacterium]